MPAAPLPPCSVCSRRSTSRDSSASKKAGGRDNIAPVACVPNTVGVARLASHDRARCTAAACRGWSCLAKLRSLLAWLHAAANRVAPVRLVHAARWPSCSAMNSWSPPPPLSCSRCTPRLPPYSRPCAAAGPRRLGEGRGGRKEMGRWGGVVELIAFFFLFDLGVSVQNLWSSL